MSLSCALGAQNGLNDSLLGYEVRYFNSSNAAEKQNLLLNKVKLYLKHDITGHEVLSEIRRIDLSEIKDSLSKADLLWNAAIVAYLNNETDRSVLYLDHYARLSRDTSLNYNLLLILVNKYRDTVLVNSKIRTLSAKDSSFKKLDCFMTVAAYTKKHLGLYMLASGIVPGSGAIMNGYVFKGAVSLALTAGSVFGIVKLVQYSLYVNAVLWGTGVGLRFYLGNIRLTEQLFYKAEARKKNKLAQVCELDLKELLKKYPLTLRGL